MDKMGIFDLLMLPFNIAIAALLLPVVLIGGIILAVALCVYTVLAALGLFASALTGIAKFLEWIDKHFSSKSKKNKKGEITIKATREITEGLYGEAVWDWGLDRYLVLATDAVPIKPSPSSSTITDFIAYAIDKESIKYKITWHIYKSYSECKSKNFSRKNENWICPMDIKKVSEDEFLKHFSIPKD